VVPQQLFVLLAEGLLARIAVKLLAPAVPVDDAAVEIPHENRVAREFDQMLLLAEPPLAFPQLLLDLVALGNIDEGEHHAVDLVIDRAVGPQAHVVPAPAAAADFAPDRGEIGKHRAGMLDQVLVLELMGKVGDRPALVGQRDAEQIGHTVGETFDAQTGIEEQRADLGRRSEIL
jgi:hypothetical protein